MKVWVVSGTSESGDDYGPIVFSKEPSEKLLSKIANSWDGKYTYSFSEGDSGPGSYGSFVYLSVEGVKVDGELKFYKNLKEPPKADEELDEELHEQVGEYSS